MSPLGTQYNEKELAKYGGKKILMYSGAVTATGNNRSLAASAYGPLNVMQFKEGTFFLRITTVGGAGTFDVTVESKDPAGSYYPTLFAFAQINAVDAGEKKDVAANLGEVLTLSWVLATFTSVTFEVYFIGKIR